MMSNHEYTDDFKAPHASTLYESTNVLNVSTSGRILSAAAGAWLISRGLHRWDKRPVSNLTSLLAGSYLLYRGLSGNCPISAVVHPGDAPQHVTATNIRASVLVNKPRHEVYAYWRKLENLPKFMTHLKEVQAVGGSHSRWVIHTIGNKTIEWEAGLVEEQEGHLIAWRSMPGSMIETAGKVTFIDAPGGGTEVQVLITYRPPAGAIGAAIAQLLNPAFAAIVRSDIRNFQAHFEGLF